MKNLLVAVDLTSTDAPLLDHACRLGKALDAKVWLLHVAAPDPDFVGYGVGPQHIRDVVAESFRQEHHQLHDYVESLNRQGYAADGLLIQGPTAEMIRQEVAKLRIDLLILGSHRHGLLYELFVGHTATRVLKDIAIPVMIIPLADES